jgi:predicted glutamine amidotransferase
MCRFYGFTANEPTKVECALVHAQNALLVQSRRCREGAIHADGWGLGCYENELPEVVRRATPAFEDAFFGTTAERVYARTVVAHVRKASVGRPALANTHPFTYACWLFAHNGTVTGFDRLASRLEQETDPTLLESRQGTTDSELAFYWLLTRMERAHLSPYEPCADLKGLVHVVGESIKLLAARCREAAPGDPAKLNFLLTDGHTLIASRWKHSLFWVPINGIHACEICGVPHVRHIPGKEYRAVAVASEAITHEPWQPVPNLSILSVDPNLRFEVHRLSES